jgi:hypothetical protein
VQKDDLEGDAVEERFVDGRRADKGGERRLRLIRFQKAPHLSREVAIDEEVLQSFFFLRFAAKNARL